MLNKSQVDIDDLIMSINNSSNYDMLSDQSIARLGVLQRLYNHEDKLNSSAIEELKQLLAFLKSTSGNANDFQTIDEQVIMK